MVPEILSMQAFNKIITSLLKSVNLSNTFAVMTAGCWWRLQ